MAPKQPNSKAEAAKAKKAENQAKSNAAKAQKAEEKEAEVWNKGAKGKAGKEDKAEKAAAAAARKAENAKLLAEEEASLPAKKPAQSGGKKAGAGKGKAVAAPSKSSPGSGGFNEVESFSATGIDDALDMMTIATEKTDKASVGTRAATSVDTHPERRFKAAFEAYKERELPRVKEERPGLRLQQYLEVLHKEFQKSPENPFNQVVANYDATKQDKVEVMRQKREETEKRLKNKD